MQKFSDVVQRIELVRKEAGMSPARFASAIRLPVKTFKEAIDSRNDPPSVELIRAVILRFGIRPNWLLNGIGPKLLQNDDSDYGWSAKVKPLRREIDALGEQFQEDRQHRFDLEDLISNIQKLKRLLDHLERELCALRDGN
jgi:hypothetical protein